MKNTRLIFVLLFLASLFSGTASAITISPPIVTQDLCSLTVSNTQNLVTSEYYLFYLSTGLATDGTTQFSDPFPVSICTLFGQGFFDYNLGSYVLVESNEDLDTFSDTCGQHQDDYTACKATGSVIGEAFFTVGQISGYPTAVSFNYSPSVDIIYPVLDLNVGKELEIKYEAHDPNDYSRIGFGLKPGPVSIYYISGYDILHPVLLAEELPAVGIYKWNTESLDEGIYRIIITAEDSGGLISESMSSALFIDSSGPGLIVTTEPPFSKGEDVKIKIESTEELAEAPGVSVVQKNSLYKIDVRMLPSDISNPNEINKKYEGVYSLIKGLDGVAKINVSGRDKFGNSGTVISGGQFLIGVEPPPKAEILTPADGLIVSTNSIDVSGIAREDLRLTLTVNGREKLFTEPDQNGSFIFKGLKLDPEQNKGVNFISVIAEDRGGKISSEAVAKVKYNVGPEVSIVYPEKDSKVDGMGTIRVNVKDQNKDTLTLGYEIKKEGEDSWTTLAFQTENRSFQWDSSKFDPGQYRIRARVSDGSSESETISEIFIIERFLPAISFSGGNTGYTNKDLVIVEGSASTPSGTKITSIEYSRDGGKNWIDLESKDKNYDSPREDFYLSLGNLVDQVTTVLFRAKDSEGFVGYGDKTIITDRESPSTPEILKPTALDPVGGSFSITGKSEPHSLIKVRIPSLGRKIYEGLTDDQGLFEVEDISLTHHGLNSLLISTIDQAGNQGPESELQVIYNNLPEIKFLEPRPNGGISHKANIKWQINDSDGDVVKDVKLSYRSERGVFYPLNITNLDNFQWNVSNIPEGKYQLQLEASDGINSVQKITDFYIDNTPPNIELDSFARTIFTKEFELNASGRASDNFSGVEFIEFAVSGINTETESEESWFKGIITDGFLEKEAKFKVGRRLKLEDGDYDVKFRAVDVAGNLSVSKKQKISIDTNAPRIGSFILSDQGTILFPEADTISVAGGKRLEFNISIENDSKKAELIISKTSSDPKEINKIELTKNASTGLWGGHVSFDYNSDLSIIAEDEFGNRTNDFSIGKIRVVKMGRILSPGGASVSGAKIKILVLDTNTNSFVDWQSSEYGRDNPVISSENGEYDILLPSGVYQLVIQAQGYKRVRVSDLKIDKPIFLSNDIFLEARDGFWGYVEDFLE